MAGFTATRPSSRPRSTTSGSFFKGWILNVLDALPKEVVARRLAASE